MTNEPPISETAANIPVSEISALLFDLGGVIIEVDSMRSVRSWAGAAGIDPQALAERWGPDAYFEQHERGELACADYFRILRDRHLPQLSEEQIRDGWNATLGEEIPGVRGLVEQLAAKIPIYVFSNSNPTHQHCWAQDCAGTLEHFREVFVSSDIGQRKPEARAFSEVAARMGLAPGQILFFDDNPENVAGARRVGMHAVTIHEHADLLRAVLPWTG